MLSRLHLHNFSDFAANQKGVQLSVCAKVTSCLLKHVAVCTMSPDICAALVVCQAAKLPSPRVPGPHVISDVKPPQPVPGSSPELLLLGSSPPVSIYQQHIHGSRGRGLVHSSQCAHHMQYEVLQSVMMLWGLRCANISCIRCWTMSSECIGSAGGSNMWYVHRRLSGENECEIMQYSVINLCKMFQDGQYALMPEAPLAGFWNAMDAMANIKLFRRSCSK